MTFDDYRQAMTSLGAADEVALVDHRVEELWARAVGTALPALDDEALASVPATVTPNLSAPANLDVAGHLDRVEGFINGDKPPPGARPRRPGLVWLGACVLFALLLGVTVRGLTVVPAFVPAIATGLLLAAFGPGRVPGWIWAIGLMPLALLLTSGSPPKAELPVEPQWFLGVIFVALIHGFARVMSTSDVPGSRRPLELEVVACTIGAATGPDAAILIAAALLGLFRRRTWTCWVAIAAGTLLLFIAFRDGIEWAHPVVLVAFIVHWVRALLSDAWKERLTRTEIILSIAGRLGKAGYRAIQRSAPALPTVSFNGPPEPPQPKNDKYPDGQFGRYCNRCHGETPHVSGGFSMPVCVQCGSRAAGGSRGDRTFQNYCANCGGQTPHTTHGCVVCSR